MPESQPGSRGCTASHPQPTGTRAAGCPPQSPLVTAAPPLDSRPVQARMTGAHGLGLARWSGPRVGSWVGGGNAVGHEGGARGWWPQPRQAGKQGGPAWTMGGRGKEGVYLLLINKNSHIFQVMPLSPFGIRLGECSVLWAPEGHTGTGDVPTSSETSQAEGRPGGSRGGLERTLACPLLFWVGFRSTDGPQLGCRWPMRAWLGRSEFGAVVQKAAVGMCTRGLCEQVSQERMCRNGAAES